MCSDRLTRVSAGKTCCKLIQIIGIHVAEKKTPRCNKSWLGWSNSLRWLIYFSKSHRCESIYKIYDLIPSKHHLFAAGIEFKRVQTIHLSYFPSCNSTKFHNIYVMFCILDGKWLVPKRLIGFVKHRWGFIWQSVFEFLKSTLIYPTGWKYTRNLIWQPEFWFLNFNHISYHWIFCKNVITSEL